ncbi:Ribosomal protein [Aphelenchoides besseyi]|nr:Ribosomal protein [Aphelenchoides besseyi]KAI6237754.1 Ribosomal protein [Aphelenchoides besseyi]
MSFARIMNAFSLGARRLLVPSTPMVEQTSGFKVKKYIKRRCEWCYIVRVNGRLHVECTRHPRHKQREQLDVRMLW